MQPALLQIQADITARLSVELNAWGVTVRSQRKMIIAKELDETLLVLTITNGKTGAGCLVHIPSFATDYPNAPGPVGHVQIVVTCLEAPEHNLNASSGTLHTAEEISIRVIQLLHLWRIVGIGTIYSAQESIRKADADQGILGYDVICRIVLGHEYLAATGNPSITGTPSEVTITNAAGYESAAIYYTTDGESYPGPEQPNSYPYSGAFAVESGTVIRAAAYLSGSVGSDILEATITS